jgi:hypothetical protein
MLFILNTHHHKINKKNQFVNLSQTILSLTKPTKKNMADPSGGDVLP